MTGGEVFLCVFIVALCIWFWRDRMLCYSKGYNNGYNDGVRSCVDEANENLKDYYIVKKTDVESIYDVHDVKLVAKEPK